MSGAGLFWQLATCVCQPYCFPALLVSLLVSYLVPHLVLIIYGYFPFITPCVFLCVVRLLWFFPLALTVSYYSPSFVLSGSSARCCFLCFSASPSVRPVTVGFHLYTCHSGLSTDSLRTVQPIARNCEQPHQLHCFCRRYGSSCRGDRTICVAEDSAFLWLPVEALITCIFVVLINLRCTRIWILPLRPDTSQTRSL